MKDRQISLLSEKFTPETLQFLKPLIEWGQSQKIRGFETRMHVALIGAFSLNPVLMTNLFVEVEKKALSKLTQDKSHSLPSLVYPIEAALRFLALRNPEVWEKNDDPLSIKNWQAKDVIRIVSGNSELISEIACGKTMAKNLPHRAAIVLELLGTTSRADDLKRIPWFIIDLGASAGLVTTGLLNASFFQEWFKQEKTVNQELQNRQFLIPIKGVKGIGLDLEPSEDDWILACTDNDSMRLACREFIQKFPDRATVVKGNALEFDETEEVKKGVNELNDGQIIILVGNFLYQLPEKIREQLLNKLSEFAKNKGALIVFNDSHRIFEPDKPGWFAWVEDKTGRISPVLQLTEEPIFYWQEVDWPPEKRLLK